MKEKHRAIILMVQNLELAKRQREKLESNIAYLQQEILKLQTAKTRELVDGKTKYRLTRVEPTSYVVRQPMLRKKLGFRLWRKVCASVLDQAKLNQAIEAGEIDATVVAECTDEIRSKPYVRVTVSKVVPREKETGPGSPRRKLRVR